MESRPSTESGSVSGVRIPATVDIVVDPMTKRIDATPFAHLDVCRLVTVGRRSGRPHDIEMWFGVVDGEVCMISGNGEGADWFRNAMHNPEVTVRFGREVFAGLARSARDGDERHQVGVEMTRKYAGWGGDSEIGLEEDDWTWRVPALIITLSGAGPSAAP
jgi:deazaflavin-dependent oxidoreductase (nitroreductase family)